MKRVLSRNDDDEDDEGADERETGLCRKEAKNRFHNRQCNNEVLLADHLKDIELNPKLLQVQVVPVVGNSYAPRSVPNGPLRGGAAPNKSDSNLYSLLFGHSSAASFLSSNTFIWPSKVPKCVT